jgi:hypothetical protein
VSSSSIQTDLAFDTPLPRTRYAYAKQMQALVEAVGDGKERSLREIETALGFRYGQSGISARTRDLHRGVPGFESWDSRHRQEKGLDGRTRHYYSVFRRDA